MKADIAIITTREDEFEAVLQRFKPVPYREPGKRSYGICHLETKGGNHYTIAIARCSEQGNDTSQQLAHDMIHDLDPRLILVVGIAGGVPHDEFTLGDVIVSTRIHNLNVGAQHEDGSSTFDIRGGIHPAISDITSSLLLYQDQLAGWNTPASVGRERPSLDPRQAIIGGEEEWRKKVQASLDLHFGTRQGRERPPKFKAGSIASSNHLMRNPLILKQWREIARTVIAVEMEAAGVYQAAQGIERQYPVMAIRGISDIVGLERDAQWTAYACQTAAAFAYAFLLTDSLDPPKSASAALSRATLLLVTTHELEARTVLALFGQGPEQKPARRFIGQNVYYALGALADANVFMVRMEPDQPAEILWEGIQALAPSTVIAVGLAFGLHPARQQLGDIIVSKQILRYEIRRIGAGPDGGPEYHFRLHHLSAPRRLYDRFRDGALDWRGTEVHFGPLLSGSIVIAERGFRDRLLQLDPALLGGDESANLYSFMAERNVNWIAVKSICDWADGSKTEGKDLKQAAAENAIHFVQHVIEQGNLSEKGRDL
jgi:nucleoside phosphorylase